MRNILIVSFVLISVCVHAQDSTFIDTRKPFIEHDTVYLEAGFPVAMQNGKNMLKEI